MKENKINKMKENKIFTILEKLEISSKESLIKYYPKVRDRDDIEILKCTKSGVIILSRTDHMEIKHYVTKKEFRFDGAPDRVKALITGYNDATRRFNSFQSIVSNKKWADIGSGPGNILDLLSPLASETVAVEPQEAAKQSLTDLGYKVLSDVCELKDNHFQVVTLFHVVEHLIDPIETLKTILQKLEKGGKIIIEIPHAEDILLSLYDNSAFKAFTFWSEHLILHTRESIEKFLKLAGYENIIINNFQRYPLANHLYWLSKAKPGGHINWHFLRTTSLDNAYGEMLGQINKTDTLIITAEKH